jgi:hypothetical protein
MGVFYTITLHALKHAIDESLERRVAGSLDTRPLDRWVGSLQ